MKKLNQKGQGMTEYILIVALIAVAVIGVVKYLGSSPVSNSQNIKPQLETLKQNTPSTPENLKK